jgi:hypothetical protein
LSILTLTQAREAASDPARLGKLIGTPPEDWANRCHDVSLRLLRTGEFGEGRVARGTAKGIIGQHSWIVLGDDVYDEDAVIVDPTITPTTTGESLIVADKARCLSNRPHGTGRIWDWGRPWPHSANYIELAVPLSGEAKAFMSMVGPLDLLGWMQLANAPVQGWPAKEILTAMMATPGLEAAAPIDHVGHVTDLNPKGLYR